MLELSDIPAVGGLPSETVLRVAKALSCYWSADMARNTELIQTLDFSESVALISAIAALGKESPTVMELGTQLGISTCIIYDGLKLLGMCPRLITYDIMALNHLFKDDEVEFRQCDLSGRCGAELDSIKPDAVFLDAHPWDITYEMTVECMKRRILIAMHDVADSLWNGPLQGGSLPLEGNKSGKNIPWERKVLEKIFGQSIHGGFAEAEGYTARLLRSRLGLALCAPNPL